MARQPRSLLSKKAVRQFIKENGEHITQVEAAFYTLMEQKIRSAILKAVANNGSRHRLTQYELLGNANSNHLR